MVALDTNFPADTLEFCPHPTALDIFVCGTYKLDELLPDNLSQGSNDEVGNDKFPSALQHRRGQCLVYQVDPPGSALGRNFYQVQSVDLPAVLDMKWCHTSSLINPILGIANSEGKITLHEWQGREKCLKQIDTIQCASQDILCLSLDWSNRKNTGIMGSLVASLSNGFLCLLHPSDKGTLSLSNSWRAHDHEPWAVAWNYWDTNVVFSGGDDLKMKGWDIRQNFVRPIFTNKKFGAGVTSIQCHPHVENLVAVGSYDNAVRLFDSRNPMVALTEVNVGGGAWRVKWHPSHTRQDDLLVACMHDGCKIVRFNLDGDHHGQVLKRFDAHESMAYGVDWSFEPFRDGTTIGSCSFYDHVCHLWNG